MAEDQDASFRVSAIPNLILAAVCLFYLVKTGIHKRIGLDLKPTQKASTMLFYLPLLVLPLLSLLYGIREGLKADEVLLLLAMYAGVGFMEEIIFRGLMLEAMEKTWKRIACFIFISATFGFGHIVSMAAIGQNGADTVLQIINATIVGIMFMLVMIASRNLTLLVVVHIAYNFLANLSNIRSENREVILVSAAVTLVYGIWLWLKVPAFRAWFRTAPGVVHA